MKLRSVLEPWLSAIAVLSAMLGIYVTVADSVEPPEYPCRSIEVADEVLATGVYNRLLTDLEIDIIAKLKYGAYTLGELKSVCRHE